MEELIELPTLSSRTALNEIIKNQLKTDRFTITITYGSSPGENFFGIIYRINAIAFDPQPNGIKPNNNINNNNNNNQINIIVKLPPQNPIRREQFFARPCFEREIFTYDKILPLFKRFQEKHFHCPNSGNPPNEINKTDIMKSIFCEIPICYRTIFDEYDEAIFFNDLKYNQFLMFNRQKSIDFEHCRLIMNVLGKLHAISFGLKRENNEEFKNYQKMNDLFRNRENVETFRNYLDHLVERAKNTLDENIHKHLIEKLTKIFNKPAMDILLEWVDGKKSEPYSVICHGDCWTNNFLFKYDKNNIPIDIRLLDWQLTRYASPVCDLTYFYFTCTTQEFRKLHYQTLLEIYHKSLSAHLISLGFNPEILFPYHALEEQLKIFGRFGLMMAIIMLPVFTALPGDVPDLDKVSEIIENNGECFAFDLAKSDRIYVERMREVIIDMDTFEYI